MTTFERYVWFQVPGWVITLALAWFLHKQFEMPLWAGGAIFLAVVIKDFVLYPWLKPGYRTHSRTGSEALIGKRGIVAEPLAPEGYVKIEDELWKARPRDTGMTIEKGRRVRVVAAEGMTLEVEPRA